MGPQILANTYLGLLAPRLVLLKVMLVLVIILVIMVLVLGHEEPLLRTPILNFLKALLLGGGGAIH